MTEKEKMEKGLLYSPMDKELRKYFLNAKSLTSRYNKTEHDEYEKRTEILASLLGGMGKDIYIEPPFRCDYGYNIFVGDNFYSNYDLIILDICPVKIGNNVLIAPRVGIYTAAHPIDSGVRNSGVEYGKPITIGDNVWIGANTVINPGVTIGNNVVIGSGSVVVKDIPSDCVAFGNPCKEYRKITDKDKVFWENMRKLAEEK